MTEQLIPKAQMAVESSPGQSPPVRELKMIGTMNRISRGRGPTSATRACRNARAATGAATAKP